MISIDSMPLIYEEHRALLKGKRQKLAQRSEALDSLTASLGIPVPLIALGGMGCTSVAAWGMGIIFTAVGTVFLILAITFSDIVNVTVLLAIGMASLVFGHHNIVQAYLSRRYPAYVDQLYKQLIAHGEIVEGTIIDIKQGPPQIIQYRFSAPSQSETYEGQYRLFTQTTLVHGQKVTVLYLNRCTHLLL